MIVLLTWLLGTASFASEVVLKSPTSSEIEYRAYMSAHPALKTPSGFLRTVRPLKSSRDQLISAFAEAQSAFLGESPESARKKIASLVALIHMDDWSAKDREVFLISYLRLAQLAADSTERQKWLTSSLALSDTKVDDSLFPPPLLNEWKQLRQSLIHTQPEFAGLGSDWSTVLINGSPCDRSGCPRLPTTLDLPVRITWLSDQWQPYTSVGYLDQLEKITPVREAWVQGHCQNPSYARSAESFGDKRAFFDIHCEQQSNKKIANLSLNDLKPQKAELPGNMFADNKDSQPFYKSPWLWAGVGVAIAVAVASAQKKPSSKEPTTTYGY